MQKESADSFFKPSRRRILGAGVVGIASLASGCQSREASKNDSAKTTGKAAGDELQRKTIDELGPYLTRQDDFIEVTRSRPYLLPPKKLAEVGLTRETWKLEVDSDPDHPADVENPLTRKLGTAFDFAALLELAKTKAVRYAKALSCLNNNRILGMGVWEGVPLRDVLWMADPKRNLRRVFYYGYHGDDPRRRFQSSLPVGRVLEDAFGLPPVILCYKLNGQWLSSKRGGPVRMIVPEAYAFKSVKWLTNVVLTNLESANDSYAKGNNDIDTHMKSFVGFVDMPSKVKANKPFTIKGYGQVGVSGIDRVQVWCHDTSTGDVPLKGRFTDAPWLDAELLPAPSDWGSSFENDATSPTNIGFEAAGNVPRKWPLEFTKLNWMYRHPGLAPGTHLIRCRSIDGNGQAQPMPRPFQKSGHAKIELQIVKSVE